MEYVARRGQVSYGHVVGILMMDTRVPFIPGDVGNAWSYRFPVLYRTVTGVTSAKVLDGDEGCGEALVAGAQWLEREGVAVITGDCGFMARYQAEVQAAVGIPVCLSSLTQLTFMDRMVPPGRKIGVVTANSELLSEEVIRAAGVVVPRDRLVIGGMQRSQAFHKAFLAEEGILDASQVERDVVVITNKMMSEERDISAILLECSDLPPYSDAVSRAARVPVFDYITMIQYLYESVVKTRYDGVV